MLRRRHHFRISYRCIERGSLFLSARHKLGGGGYPAIEFQSSSFSANTLLQQEARCPALCGREEITYQRGRPEMRYIDTGSRDVTHALGAWLQSVLTPAISEVRWQSGFFNEDPLGIFTPTLQRLAQADRTVHT